MSVTPSSAPSKAQKLSAVKGMNDILPAAVPRTEKLPSSERWQWFESAVRKVLARYGYQYLLTPVVEPTALFVRGLGEVTDIVEKEMYSFTDAMNGDQLTLRPEGTAGVVRAMIEHNALYNGPLRLWTAGPMFRHERPQKGRYRQFHQLDVEALGFAGPDVDAEMILVARALWRELGLVEGQHVRLEINSLGQSAERRAHRDALVRYFEDHADALDEDARRRLHSNPLRILDSKNPAMQALIEAAPQLMDFLGAESRAHFDAVRAALDAVGLAYRINPRLVRGMDYYNLTVFEWVTDQLGSQGTVCGGGRYDGLIAQLGGKSAPAVGFGLGIERLLLLAQELDLPMPSSAADAYAVVPPGTPLAPVVATLEALRAQGVRVIQHAGSADGVGSMKSQFKKADASGARHALVFGSEELARGQVLVKALRDGSGAQVERSLADVAQWAATLQSNA
ncbi:histidyl-tRNA synthetase [Paenacidovorax caeni]|uniref:Histidine--tRNA ligase n=2 Tax=Paenacidovorax caeni TaxID=343013 RepID=A0A1I7IT98_9BURK|nr:histidyl-tRNA synthetase [Paenacidovorax caeni]